MSNSAEKNETESKTSSKSKSFKKNRKFPPRKHDYHLRPPIFMPRGRAMPGSYFSRSFNRPPFRQQFPLRPGFPSIYPHQPPAIHPFRAPIGHFDPTSTSTRNDFHNQNVIFSSSPMQGTVINKDFSRPDQFYEFKSPGKVDDNSDVWFEALKPTGDRYFYNTRTNETSFEKPMNVKITEIGEIQQHPENATLQHTQVPTMQNSNFNVRPMLNIISPNSFTSFPPNFNYPPPRGILWLPGKFENTPNAFVQNTISNVHPSAMLPFQQIGQQNPVNNCIFNWDAKPNAFCVESSVPNGIQEQVNLNQPFLSSEGKVLDWSSSVTSLSSPDSTVQNSSTNLVTPQVEDKSQNSEIRNDVGNLNHAICSSKLNKNEDFEKKERSSKSRPVSSTHVSGTYWSVVWTGDERVFFYNQERKLSVWERPVELLNRPDVDKLVEKPILRNHEKPETRVVTKSDASSKKMKKVDEKDRRGNKMRDAEESKVKRNEVNTAEKEHSNVSELSGEKESFRSLLEEANVSAEMRFIDFAKRYKNDIRFKSIENFKEKESAFYDFVSESTNSNRDGKSNEMKQNDRVTNLPNEMNSSRQNETSSEFETKVLSKEYPEKNHSIYSKENFHKFNEAVMKLYFHPKNYQKQQKLQALESADSSFTTFAKDSTKFPKIDFRSAKNISKDDYGLDDETLKLDDKTEDTVIPYTQDLNTVLTGLYHCLIDEIPNLTLVSAWEDVKNVVLNDSRSLMFSRSERECEKEFKSYQAKKLKKFVKGKASLLELLNETKMITWKSKFLLKNKNYLNDMEKLLSNDPRYSELKHMPDARRKIILSYIDKLHNEVVRTKNGH